MDAKNFSRRSFLRILSRAGSAVVVGKIMRFFPEIETVWAKGETLANSYLQIPDDIVLKAVRGEEALEQIHLALKNDNARHLHRSLPSFKPDIKQSRVTSATWSSGAQQALIVEVPFTNPHEFEAVLLYVVTNGVPQTVIVEFVDPLDKTRAKVYTLSSKEVSVEEASPRILAIDSSASVTATSCTTSCIINCLPTYGCSGMALTLCAASLLSCPFFLGSCIAAAVCTLYCGVAFSKCVCKCCGC